MSAGSDSVAGVLEARFGQSRNDMHWEVFDLEDGFVRWSGYDDSHWWDRVSNTPAFRDRTGKVTGRLYTLDPHTHNVMVAKARSPQ